MKCIKKIIAVTACIICLLLVLVSCGNKNETKESNNQKIYIQAQQVGFTGTYEKWCEVIKGIDDTTITSVTTNENQELIINLKDGTQINLGRLNTTVEPIYQGMSLEKINKDDRKKEKNRIIKHTIKDAIDEFLDISTTEKIEYYVNKKEHFNIVIHLYNPTSYEILSFVLNDNKYQSYQFKEGSTSDKLIVEVEANTKSGIFEYTIDQIKYIDKEKIKDVKMDGNKTIKVGVKYDVVPTATVISEEITTTSYQLVIELKDDSSLLNSKNGANFFLYDGKSVVYKQVLKLGINTIKYDNLQMGLEYEWLVVGVYDDCSGDGMKAVNLAESTFESIEGIKIDSLESTQNQIRLKLVKTVNQVNLQTVNLYDGNNKIQSIKSSTEVVFTNLLSDHEYKVEALYSFMFNGVERTNKISQQIKTLKNETPTIQIDSLNSTKRQIIYRTSEVDKDGVILSRSFNLIKNSKIVKSSQTNEGVFNDLLSDNTYEFEVIYTYDLNDGRGIQNLKQQQTIKTKALSIPRLDISTSFTSNQIRIKEIVSDTDNIIKVFTPAVIDETSVEVKQISDFEYLLDNIKSNYTYLISIAYQYDLNDGTGVKEESKEFKVTTNKQIPIIKFTPYNITQESIEYALIVLDNNVTGRINLITLYTGTTFVKRLNLVDSKIDGLMPNTNYIIKIDYVYDFDDGFGSREIHNEYNFTTLKRDAEYNLSFTNITTSSFELSHHINDQDRVLSFKELTLVLNDRIITNTKDINQLRFEGLLADNEYKVIVKFEKDLNNGKEEISYTYYVTTSKYNKPIVEFNLSSTKTTILYNYWIHDVDNIATFYEIALYYDGVRQSNIPLNQIFNNLFSDTSYVVRVYLLNDYHNGAEPKLEYYDESITTKPLDDAQLSINLYSEKKSIKYSYELVDIDNIINIKEIKLYQGDNLVDTIANLTIDTFTGLYSDTYYRVVFIVEKDFRNNKDKVIAQYESSTYTKALTIPQLDATFASTTNSIKYNLTITDVDNILVLQYLELHSKNQTIHLDDFDSNVITNLNPNTSYEIVFTYIYDLNDQTDAVVQQAFFTYMTLASEVSIVNDETLKGDNPIANEALSIKLYLNNPSRVILEYVVVNGKMYDIVGGDRVDTVIFIVKLPKESGKFTLNVEKFGYVANAKVIEQMLTENNTIELNVMSKLGVIDIYIANGGTIDKENENLGYVIKIDNPHSYVVTEITFGDGSGYNNVCTEYPIMIDDNHLFVTSLYYSVGKCTITTMKYIDDSGNIAVRRYSETIDVNFTSVKVDPETNGVDIEQVSTPEQFMNMKENKVYQLVTDLNMSGYNWEPYEFTGYFDGNGHTISNLSYIHDDEWGNSYSDISYASSLFIVSSDCVFKNVFFSNLYFCCNSKAWPNNVYTQLFGSYYSLGSTENRIKNILINGSIVLERNGEMEGSFNLLNNSIYIVDKLYINNQLYDGSNIISIEKFESEEFRNDVLKWNFTDKVIEEYEGLKYISIDNSYTYIIGYEGVAEKIVIPETINNLPVIGVDDLVFQDVTTLKYLEIPSSVISLGTSILNGCYNLDTLVLGNIDARNLVDLFGYKEYKYTYTTTNSQNSYNYHVPKAFKKLVISSRKGEIPDVWGMSFASLNTLVIGENIKTIGSRAFAHCTNLIYAVLPNDLISLGSQAFYECKSLLEISIPNSITTLQKAVFADCLSLEKVKLPSNLQVIEVAAFSGCISLPSIDLPNSVIKIGQLAFRACTNLKSIKLPSNLKVIESISFEECHSLESVVIPDSVTTIEDGAFGSCHNLSKVTIGKGVETICAYAFNLCYQLKRVYIPANVTRIDSSAFGNYETIIECEVNKKPATWAKDWFLGIVRWGVKK